MPAGLRQNFGRYVSRESAIHGLDPFAYLCDVIDRLARGDDPSALTPAAWKARQLDQTEATD